MRDQTGILLSDAPADSFLVSGERQVAIGVFVSLVEVWKDQGKPVELVQFVVAPLADPPHPNASRLLAGWLASDEGKLKREELRHDSDVRPGSGGITASKLRQANVALSIEDEASSKARAELYEKLAPIVTGQVQ
jgi:hypothetical protein